MKLLIKTTTLVVSLILLLSSVSCKKYEGEIIWDFYPTRIEMLVTDKDGNNLLDEKFAGNILSTDITMEYNGKIYKRLDDCGFSFPDNPETKDIGPVDFCGLQTDKTGEQVLLVIGYFKRNQTLERQNFIINWGDGTKTEIGYSQDFWWEYNRKKKRDEPQSESHYWLDGQAVSSPIRIVR